MATRKAITLVSGLFQEVNTPTDKLDFAGNTTADLTENTNLYYTNTRSRAAISVTDVSGDGSLAYNNSTGVITYTGPSPAEVRAHLSIASGSGLTYNSGTGEFGTSAIPNSQLANDDVTFGNTSVALGSSTTNLGGMNSITTSTLNIETPGASNHILLSSSGITFEGSTADANETILTVADATGGDKTLTLPNETGTILSTASSIANSNLANSAVTIGSTSVSLGATANTIAGLNTLTSSSLIATTALRSGATDSANSIQIANGIISFEGSTANDFETGITVTDPTTDRTITFPDATGTVALLSTLSIASGSGLTYNSSTGEFSTNAIPNSKLANSSITVGSTAIALGSSSTTLTGLASVTSTAVVTNDSGFRIRDNSDNTKQLAFECSGISGSTTRTLTAPDVDGTLVLLAASQTLTNKTLTSPVLTSPVLNTGLSGSAFLDEDDMASNSATKVASQQSIKAYVDTQLTAEDLDVQTDSGNFDVDLDSEPLILTGGTGIDTSGSGTTATFAIDSTVTTLTGTQTLTNKSLDAPVLVGSSNSAGSIIFKEDTDNGTNAATLKGPESTADVTLTLPATDGTVSTESFATAIAVALG
jgi:hypothetical protein